MPINLTKNKICLTHGYNYIKWQKQTFLNQKKACHCIVNKSNSWLFSSNFTHNVDIGIGLYVLIWYSHYYQSNNVHKISTVCQPAQWNPKTSRQDPIDQTLNRKKARKSYHHFPPRNLLCHSSCIFRFRFCFLLLKI